MSGAPERCELEEAIGHRFADPALLETALAHPSWAHEADGSRGNERLEFLGDAVLGLVVADRLYASNPQWTEGQLTRARASLVNRRSLAERARELELGGHIKLGRTEQLADGSGKDSILANCLEALVAAVYLDGGLPAATGFVERLFGAAFEPSDAPPTRDAKTRLNELALARFQTAPRYRTVADSGTENDEKRFTVEVCIQGQAWGQGVGRSKQVAERAAAAAALASPEAADG